MASDERTRRLVIAATAAIGALALGGGWWMARLDRGETRLRSDGGDARPAPVEASDSSTGALPAAREPLAAHDAADRTADGAAPRPTGEVVGSVRRQRDGSAVQEGVVALAFVDLADDRLRFAPWAGLSDNARAEMHEFEEARIEADGTFRMRLPAPALVRRAAVRPVLQRNQAPQFLELEEELADLPLAVDGTLELPLVVDDGASIEGVVVTAEGGFPLRGARVAIPWWSDGNSDWACETDVDGRFRVAGIRREVAAARSNSEAVASCAGYMPRRFLVPPAEDGLDVTGLRLEMVRGIKVVVELVPPVGLDAAQARTWEEALYETSATLKPTSREPTTPYETLPWLARARLDPPNGSSHHVEFEPIAPTRDAIVVVLGKDGRPIASMVVDASEERAPWQLTLPLPGAAPKTFEHIDIDGNGALLVELQRVDGMPIGYASVSTRLSRGDIEVGGKCTADEEGRVRVPRPKSGFVVELRVAGFESGWIVEPERPAPEPTVAPGDAVSEDPLVVTLRALPPAR